MNNLQLRQEVPMRSRDVKVYDSAYAFNESNACSVQNEGNNLAECLSTLINETYLTVGMHNSNVQNRTSNRVDLCSLAMRKCPSKISAIAISSDGQLCAGALSSSINVWQVATGQLLCILKKHNEEVTCLRFSSNGSYLVSGGADHLVMAWSLDSILTAEAQENIKPWYVWCDHPGKIIDIYVSQFAAISIVVTVSDQLCKVYSLKSGTCVLTISSKVGLTSVTMDPAEFFIFLGNTSGEVIQCMFNDYSESPSDDNTESQMWAFRLHERTVSCLATSLDGEMLFSGCIDGTVVIWNIYTQTVMKRLRHSGPVLNGFLTPNPLMKGDAWKTMKPFQFQMESSSVEELEVLPKSFKPKTGHGDGDTMDNNPPMVAPDLSTTTTGVEDSINAGLFMFIKTYMAEETLEDLTLKNPTY